MDRCNNIIKNKRYIDALQKIEELEKERIFCLHGIDHSLDTARIAYILCLEKQISVKKDIIYAAALLHDIGRSEKNESEIQHDELSAKIASEILPDCGYNINEIDTILKIIKNHRTQDSNNQLNNIFYKADKLSRKCYCCKAIEQCYWKPEKMNLDIQY